MDFNKYVPSPRELQEQLSVWWFRSRKKLLIRTAVVVASSLVLSIALVVKNIGGFWPNLLVFVCIGSLAYIVVPKMRDSQARKQARRTEIDAAEEGSENDTSSPKEGESRKPSRTHRLQHVTERFHPDNREQVLPGGTAPVDLTKPFSDLSVEEWLQLSHTADIQTPDDTEYWHKNPHPKHFWKRIWRIVLAWAVTIGLIVGVVKLTTRDGVGGLSFNQAVLCAALIAFAVWYTLRRIRKWQNLYLVIRGNWVYVEETVSRLFLLNGRTYQVPIVACNNIKSRRTTLELLFMQSKEHFQCGVVDINSPIDADDVFRDLTDVRDHEQFAEILRQRYDDLMSGSSGILRRELNNP